MNEARPANPSAQTWYPWPAWSWLASFVICITADAILGRWLLLPAYIACFYGGMIVITLSTYPLLGRWRAWLRPRGVWAWYTLEIGVMWIGTSLILVSLAPVWLSWNWSGPPVLQALGAVLVAVSVPVGVWTVGQLGWGRMMFTGALFVPKRGTESLPERLVVTGPFRYLRHPSYASDMVLLLGAALLTQNWGLLALLGVYILQLVVQLRLEERELTERFGEPYRRYRQRVPSLVPRLMPIDPLEVHGD